MVECFRCGCPHSVKAGFMQGQQRYKCKECGYFFIDKPRRGVSPILRSLATWLHFCGLPQRQVARLFSVSPVAVLKWVDRLNVGKKRKFIPQKSSIRVLSDSKAISAVLSERASAHAGRIVIVVESDSFDKDIGILLKAPAHAVSAVIHHPHKPPKMDVVATYDVLDKEVYSLAVALATVLTKGIII